MSSPGTPTYDQLRVFLAVVEIGSFAAAGWQLNRATSVISYGIANLETQLGLLLFDRKGTRKPILTAAGRSVPAETRAIAHGMDGLRTKVKGLLEGLEPEVSVAVDVMWPSAWLGATLTAFNREFPTVTLRLHVEALAAVAALVLDGRAVIGISGPQVADLDRIEHVALGSVPLIPVAAPGHRSLSAASRRGRRATISNWCSPTVRRSPPIAISRWSASGPGLSPISAQSINCSAKTSAGAYAASADRARPRLRRSRSDDSVADALDILAPDAKRPRRGCAGAFRVVMNGFYWLHHIHACWRQSLAAPYSSIA